MAILASLIVAAVGRRAAARFEAATRDPVAVQQRKLLEILRANRDTEYGREYGFADVRDLRAYQAAAPVVDYDAIRARVDRVARGEKRVLTAEDPVMFAQTSGTTGEPKLIPVTPTCQGRDHADQMRTWLCHAQRAHPRIFRGAVLGLVSPAVEGTTPAGIPYGSTSGMIYRDMHPLVRRAYAIPYEVFEIKNYDAKYYTIMRLGLAADVTLIATANPASVLQLVEMADTQSEHLIRDLRDGTLRRDLNVEPEIRRLVEGRLAPDARRASEVEGGRQRRGGRLRPADYWPHLALIGCWKGGTVGTAIDNFAEWFDPDQRGMAPVRDWGYLSSEARGSIPLSDDGDGGVLSVSTNAFEFVAAQEIDDHPDDRKGWTFRGIDAIEVGKEYYVFLTTTGGLYRYDINDVVEVVGTYNRTPTVAFRRKGRGMASMTGEKLSVNQVIDAMSAAGQSLGLSLEHFRAEPDTDNSRYVFKVEGVPEERGKDLLKNLDETLCKLNVEYKSKRSSRRLKAPVLQVMKEGWHERQDKRAAADGQPTFQAKEVVLDAKQPFHPEPDDLAAEVALDEAS